MKSSKADAVRWLRQAENDLKFAQLALREGFYSQACFVSHQVGEKTLKALAYYRGDRYVTGHSLYVLITSLETTYPQMTAHRNMAKALDKYYIPTRYPDALPGGVPFEVYDDRGDAVEAVDGAEAMLQAVRSLMAQ